MSFPFYNNAKQALTLSLQGEPISIGCEAWIDVGRFSAREKSLPAVAVDPRTPQGSLTKSFAGLRRKLRRSSPEDID
jgi:hypothetical protein